MAKKFKGVRQTRTGDNGNCFQACVATILDLPLEVVPDFCNVADIDNWWRKFQDWLEKYNLGAINIHTKGVTPTLSEPPYRQQVIMSGYTSRSSKRLHSVVGEYKEEIHNFETIWDPHESEEGLVEITEFLFIVHKNPDMEFDDKVMTCATCGKLFPEDDNTYINAKGYHCDACGEKAEKEDRARARKNND